MTPRVTDTGSGTGAPVLPAAIAPIGDTSRDIGYHE